jgi:hypothetical protein
MEEYWIGKGIDYRRVWREFDDGAGYIEKFHSKKVHLIRITLSYPSKDLPLFNHEAVYKTIKGYFHDLKEACLKPSEYDEAGPLFLYSVDRGSSIWEFLGELRQLLLLGSTLADEKVMGEKLANVDKRIELFRKLFGNAAVSPQDFQAFMAAKTPRELDKAIHRLIEQGIQRIEVSAVPFEGNIEETRKSLIDFKGQ